ncbi:MAG: methyltransferase domain-containing protein [Chlorobiaceae bacterium]
MNAAFRVLIDEAYLSDPANRIRWSKTIDFISDTIVSPGSFSRGLDLGNRTPLTASLEKLFGCDFESTTIDLDVERLGGSFDIVTAFEVLEHLYNPLHALLEVGKCLDGEDARLFVSMPIVKPTFLTSPNHFHEMSRSAALSLFNRAGYRVIRSREFRIRCPLFYFTGIKPLLRAWYEKVQIYELAVS